MPSVKTDFPRRLKAARKAKGCSQAALAERINLQRSSVSKMEAEANPNLPSVEILVALAHELEVSADYLLGLS